MTVSLIPPNKPTIITMGVKETIEAGNLKINVGSEEKSTFTIDEAQLERLCGTVQEVLGLETIE